jgi:pimeloyl-ACP methyl ester carboxylesterase
MSRRGVSLLKVVLLLVVLGVGGLLAAYTLRNPEKDALDATARREAPGQFVTLGDGVTHYEVTGPDTGGRVVLVHGFSVPSYIWDSTSIALAREGFRVARYDVFGRGWSDRPDVAYTADLFDRQLGQLLDSLGWRGPVHVVGLSRGGPTVATFAGRHKARVASLTLVDPAAGASDGVPGMFALPVVGPILWQTLAVPGMADGQLGDFLHPEGWSGWPDRYRPQTRYKGFGRALLSTIREDQAVSYDSVYALAGSTGVPTLLLWGKQDTVVPITEADGVRKAIPQAQYHPIDSAGHLPHMEQAATFHRILIDFLRAHAPARDSVMPQ